MISELIQLHVFSSRHPLMLLQRYLDSLVSFLASRDRKETDENMPWYLTPLTLPTVISTLFDVLMHVFLCVSTENKGTISNHSLNRGSFDDTNKASRCPSNSLKPTETMMIGSSSIAPHRSTNQHEDKDPAPPWLDSFWASLTMLLPLFHQLVHVAKQCPEKHVLSNCLSNGMRFLDHFSQVVMPLFQRHFNSAHRDTILQLLRLLQLGTRSMHMICTHTKLEEASMASRIPGVKKTLERVVFQVKRMLEANGCVGAFWIGHLKHRNLAGEEIGSQFVTNASDLEEEASEKIASESEDVLMDETWHDQDNTPLVQRKRKEKDMEPETVSRRLAKKVTSFLHPTISLY